MVSQCFFLVLLEVIMWTPQSALLEDIEVATCLLLGGSEIVKLALQRKRAYKINKIIFLPSDWD